MKPNAPCTFQAKKPGETSASSLWLKSRKDISSCALSMSNCKSLIERSRAFRTLSTFFSTDLKEEKLQDWRWRGHKPRSPTSPLPFPIPNAKLSRKRTHSVCCWAATRADRAGCVARRTIRPAGGSRRTSLDSFGAPAGFARSGAEPDRSQCECGSREGKFLPHDFALGLVRRDQSSTLGFDRRWQDLEHRRRPRRPALYRRPADESIPRISRRTRPGENLVREGCDAGFR